jgi:uncharacterized membrane protein YbhN (UPF0104 family)
MAVRLSALLALAPLLLIRRRWLLRTLQLLGHVMRRTFDDSLLPSQEKILSSFGWTLFTLVANCVAFSLLLLSLQAGASIWSSAAAFGLAWAIGFAAVPFPSGIGVREAVLLFTIGFAVSRSNVIAASISYRLVVMAVELLVVISSRIRHRVRPFPVGAHDRSPR